MCARVCVWTGGMERKVRLFFRPDRLTFSERLHVMSLNWALGSLSNFSLLLTQVLFFLLFSSSSSASSSSYFSTSSSQVGRQIF